MTDQPKVRAVAEISHVGDDNEVKCRVVPEGDGPITLESMTRAQFEAGEISVWYGHHAGEEWLKTHRPRHYAAGARPYYLGI